MNQGNTLNDKKDKLEEEKMNLEEKQAYKASLMEKVYEYPHHWMLTRMGKLIYETRNEIACRELQLQAGGTVLDIGCGDGRFCFKLTDSNDQVFVCGIDISLRALRFARFLAFEAYYSRASCTLLPFCDKTFDRIAALDVSEHLDDKSEFLTLKEIYRVLKDDGRLVVSVPTSRKRLEERHWRHYDENLLREHLESAGFYILKFTGCQVFFSNSLNRLIGYACQIPKFWKLFKFIAKETHPKWAKTIIAVCKK